MVRLLLSLVATLTLALAAVPADAQAPAGAPRLDAAGDPLPPAAVARLGTLRFRPRNLSLVGLTPDGKSLLLEGAKRLHALDLQTGKLAPWGPADVAPGRDARVVMYPRHDTGPLSGMIFGSNDMKIYFRVALRGLDTVTLHLLAGGARTLLVREAHEDGEFSVFDSATGKRLHRLRRTDLTGDGDGLSFLAVSPDGKYLLTQTRTPKGESTQPTGVRCYDLATRKLLYETSYPKGSDVLPLAVGAGGMAGAAAGGTLVQLVVYGGANKGEVQLWDIATGKQTVSFAAPATQFAEVQLVAGDKVLVASDAGAGGVRVFDTATGVQKFWFEFGQGGVQSFVASADGKQVFITTTLGTDQWELTHGTKVRTYLPGHGSGRTALSPDGGRLYFVGDTAVYAWDTTTGKELTAFAGHASTVWSVAFAPDGKTIVTASDDGTARLWDVATAKQLAELSAGGRANRRLHDTQPFDLAPYVRAGFTSDGKRVVATWPGAGVELWDAATLQGLPALLPPHMEGSYVLAIAGRDNLAATLGPDGQIRLWDAGHGEARLTLPWQPGDVPGPAPELAALAFSPSASALAVAGLRSPDNRLKVFETSTGKLRLDLDLAAAGRGDVGELPALVLAQRAVTRMVYSQNGKTLVLAGPHALYLHDALTGKERLVLAGPGTFGPSVALSPDGSLVAAGTLDGRLRLWSAATGKLLVEQKGHDAFVAATAFSPDGKTLATAANDTTVLLWDVSALLREGVATAAPAPMAALDRLWEELAGADAAAAARAMAALAENPDSVPAYVKARVAPVPPVEAKRLKELVVRLDSNQYAERTKASQQLEQLGDLAVVALRAKLAEQPPLEVRKRIELLLDKILGPLADPGLVRALRAVEVLEMIGTPEARAVLETLAAGAPEHRLTRAAADALRRLKAG
jgi:WD40 repeat protein